MARPGGLGQPGHSVALDGHPVGVLDGSEPGGYSRLAGGDGMAVAAAVGAYGQGLAVALYFADVGFSFIGVGGNGEDGGAGGGGVEDEGDGLGFGVVAGQGNGSGTVDLWPGPFGVGSAVSGSVVDAFEQGVGAVELVAGGGEVLADGAEVGAAGDAVLQEAGGFGLVGVGAGAGVDASWVLSGWLMAPVWTKWTRPWAKVGDWGRAASQMARRRAVRWSTALPWALAAAMPSSMRRSYRDRRGRSVPPDGRVRPA
jgi:hypothetical protein